jgi:hypothetical protein
VPAFSIWWVPDDVDLPVADSCDALRARRLRGGGDPFFSPGLHTEPRCAPEMRGRTSSLKVVDPDLSCAVTTRGR